MSRDARRHATVACLTLLAIFASGCASVVLTAAGASLDHVRLTHRVPTDAAARLTPGSNVRLKLRDGSRLKGVFVSVSSDSLRVRTHAGLGGGIADFSNTVHTECVALADVVAIEERRPGDRFALVFLGAGIAIDVWLATMFANLD